MKLAVEIEDIESWPANFREEAVKNKPLLISYHQESRRISRLGEEDLIARAHPPHNEYKAEYSALADRLEIILMDHKIVGYHCTRLTASEIRAVKDSGLKILTKELVWERFNQALDDGHLTKEQILEIESGDDLKDNLDDKNGVRTEMIWFCANRSLLREYRGVYRLLRSWGGEAVYRGHENDDPLSQTIRNVGTPCIVKCALPFSEAGHFWINFSERFLSYLVTDVIESPEPHAQFEIYANRNLAPTEILEIFDISHPEFVQLLDYNKWKDEFPL